MKKLIKQKNKKQSKNIKSLKNKKFLFNGLKKLVSNRWKYQIVKKRFYKIKNIVKNYKIRYIKNLEMKLLQKTAFWIPNDYDYFFFTPDVNKNNKTELGEREPFYANISDERTKFSFSANRKKIMGNYLRALFYQQQINYKKKLSKKNFYDIKWWKAFKSLWKEQKTLPWFDSLMFKRNLYTGSMGNSFLWMLRRKKTVLPWEIREHKRYKNNRDEKRNKLYLRFEKLLYNSQKYNTIQKDKFPRTKNILEKIILPLYGNLTKKQFFKIYKKIQVKKSIYTDKSNLLLTKFENRLDVVVYRLNLAPTILWARRMILAGAIFVKTNDTKYIVSNNKNFLQEKISFPLKLRNPYKLYPNIISESLFKFSQEPIFKIDYQVKPGDLVQCSSSMMFYNWLVNNVTLQKSIPFNFLTKNSTTLAWKWTKRDIAFKPKRWWNQKTKFTTSSIILFNPKHTDFRTTNRSKELFINWATL